MKRLLALVCLSALSLFAADISGNWKATAEGPNGPMERTFAFKQEGTKLTGKTVSSFTGESVIQNGKVEGDSVTFTIDVRFGDNEMKLNYKGKISGDTIKFTVENPQGGGMNIEWNAKKVS